MKTLSKLSCASLCLSGLLACSGGGSGDGSSPPSANHPPTPPASNSPPSVTIDSPANGVTASSESIMIEGRASDADGVAWVRVNGMDADTDDGFASWRMEVALNEGANALLVAAGDTLGNSDTSAARLQVQRRYLFDAASAIVMDSRRKLALLIDEDHSTVLRVSADSRQRSEFTGSGQAWQSPREILLDSAADRALVYDAGRQALVAVNLDDGSRTDLSSANTGTGPALSGVGLFTLDPGARRCYALSATQLVSIDLDTGNRQALALSGPAISGAQSARIDVGNRRLLVSAADTIYAVDLSSGRSSALLNFSP